MAKGYHHLTYGSRCQIYALKKSGMSVRGMARLLGVSASTVSRELRRNRGWRGYRMKQAQRFSEARRREASSRPRKLTVELRGWIEGRLRLHYRRCARGGIGSTAITAAFASKSHRDSDGRESCGGGGNRTRVRKRYCPRRSTCLAASEKTVIPRRAGMNYRCDRLTLSQQAPIRSAGDPVQATLRPGHRKSWQER